MADEYEVAQKNWYKVESCLWIMVLFTSVFGFKVFPRLLSSEKVSLQSFRVVAIMTAVFAQYIVLEPQYQKILPAKIFDFACNINAVVMLVLPFVWFFLVWPEFHWLSFVFIISAFMSFVMFPHFKSIFVKKTE